MSEKNASAVVEKMISDKSFRREVISQLPKGVTYEKGNEGPLAEAISEVVASKGYEVTADELIAATRQKMKTMSKLRLAKVGMELIAELQAHNR